MPAIARGQENTTSIINWFVTLSGSPFNPVEVGFRVIDITGGLPGTQVFPTTPGTYEDVTNAPGRFADGSFYAYDNTAGAGWTPELTANLGTHRVEWRWRDMPGGPYWTGAEDVQVISGSAGASDPLYVSVADIRALGVPDPPSDVQVEAAIRLWQKFIERACRQWFYPKDLEMYLDGTDSDAIHFGVPIISIDEVRINDDPNPLAAELYRVYNAIDYPLDRQNPRVKLVSADRRPDIYTAPFYRGRHHFRKGRQNQYVKGTFGYVEADGSVPALIQRAVSVLVIEKLLAPIYPDPSLPSPPPLVSGVIKEEKTDGHAIKYDVTESMARPAGLSGITSNQEVLDIIRLYKAPIGCATPAHPSIR